MSDEVEIKVVNNNPRAIPVRWDDPMGAVGWKRPEVRVETAVESTGKVALRVVGEDLGSGGPDISVNDGTPFKRGRGRPRKIAWECPRCKRMKSPYEKECNCE